MMRRLLLIAILWNPVAAFGQFGTVGGVAIDAKGMLRQTPLLDKEKLEEVARQLRPGNAEITKASPLRKISLRRLEAEVARLSKAGKPIPPELRFLGGITRVQYLVFAEDDVIIAGPAANWKTTPTGEVVSVDSGRPVLHLDDLVIALRTAFAARVPAFLGCSIEPTAEGVNRYAALMRRVGRITPANVNRVLRILEQGMGPQDVKIYGVPKSSRFALVMLAADYRMKRIAMGHDPSPVKSIRSYLQLAARSPRAATQQHRWWFVAAYDAILKSPSGNVFEFQGQALKVATAPTHQKPSAKPTAAATKFATGFTKGLPELAKKQPIFAELQNLVGLAVAAELMAQRAEKDGNAFQPRFLASKDYSLTTYSVPRQVPAIGSAWRASGAWLLTVSGGVEMRTDTIVKQALKKAAAPMKLARVAIPKKRWWWD